MTVFAGFFEQLSGFPGVFGHALAVQVGKGETVLRFAAAGGTANDAGGIVRLTGRLAGRRIVGVCGFADRRGRGINFILQGLCGLLIELLCTLQVLGNEDAFFIHQRQSRLGVGVALCGVLAVVVQGVAIIAFIEGDVGFGHIFRHIGERGQGGKGDNQGENATMHGVFLMIPFEESAAYYRMEWQKYGEMIKYLIL